MKSYITVKKCMQMKNTLILNGYEQRMNWKLLSLDVSFITLLFGCKPEGFACNFTGSFGLAEHS